MRILIISYFFPPFNTIGSVRVGKTAKYLSRLGHDVRVIAAKEPALQKPLPATLPLEIPETSVVYAPWWDFNQFGKKALGRISGKQEPIVRGWRNPGKNEIETKTGGFRVLLGQAVHAYRSVVNFPDGRIGWIPHATRAAETLLKDWRPDVIWASAPPYSGALVGYRLSKRHNIPWFVEMRDLWMDNPAYRYPVWRKTIESKLERRVLSSTHGLLTASEPLAQTLRAKFDCPVEVMVNGFDEEDFARVDKTPAKSNQLDIVYTGSVYDTWQDPTPLFKALRLLGEDAGHVRVHFYSDEHCMGYLRRLIENEEVAPFIELHGLVPYKKSVQLQCEADVLLLLLWNDPAEPGVYTGKIFEYIGARRPILAIGYAGNNAAELVRERQAGFVSDDPQAIAAQLREWVAQKKQAGATKEPPTDARVGLSRREQVQKIVDFISRRLGS